MDLLVGTWESTRKTLLAAKADRIYEPLKQVIAQALREGNLEGVEEAAYDISEDMYYRILDNLRTDQPELAPEVRETFTENIIFQ
jgi:hypothetical protein